MTPTLPFILYAGLVERSEHRRVSHLDFLVESGQISQRDRDARLAVNLPERPSGELLWIHAETTHAARSAFELFAHIRDERPDLAGIVTICPSAEPPAALHPHVCQILPVPEDTRQSVQRFLTHWDPDALIWIGGGYRPALLRRAKERKIPTLSIEAPDTSTDLFAPHRIPGLLAATMRCFDRAVTAKGETLPLWRRAGLAKDQVDFLGYIEESGIAPVLDDDELEYRLTQIGTRPVWFAAQIAANEMRDVIYAHKRALRRAHRLLLAISLAETGMRKALHDQLSAAGLVAIDLLEAPSIHEAAQVVLLPGDDDLGDADALWHRIASTSFLGKSLAHLGGTNPSAAAAMGSAILHGPHVDNFSNFYARLAHGGATCQVGNGTQLAEEVDRLLAPDHAALMANAAWEVTSSGAEVTERVVALAHDMLDLSDRNRA
ncbi:3-deoxy-D-manno-octulosonic acid transferase [Celeribacter litoreus]|uniref:3-deoxy-D-manno-octulosonic acid transferase n=1 Tax=Celeribacter litoreus TaxID=2876714 RepID=UPI001CCAB3AC|nr:glycosyltransferase N-terminal domain-containing protein [Celeribacter litoreus]MCA0041941.1 hypothetical protein [Celeribacter litoreus]